MAKCNTCEADIVWVWTDARRKMPIDANITVENATMKDITATFEELRAKLGKDVVVSHFSTCPDADEHRRPR